MVSKRHKHKFVYGEKIMFNTTGYEYDTYYRVVVFCEKCGSIYVETIYK